MTGKKLSVLIVDDEQVVCNLLYNELSERGCLCSIALNGHDALTQLASKDFDVVLLDIKLPGMSGMEVLSTIRSAHHNTAAIMITGVNSVDTAVEAMKLGAADYIVKPFSLDEVNTSIQTVLETKKRLAEEGDHQTLLLLGSEAQDKAAGEESYREMDAIARGVESRHDLISGHSRIVAQETIDIARHLGIPEKVIQRWADARSRLDSERNRIIGYSLDKLERSPLAQKIMGVLSPYLYTPKSDESQN